MIVDDVHRLDRPIFAYLSDYLKILADSEDESKKLILLGIPRTGHALIELADDLATRIDRFSFGRVNDDDIDKMITLGENALNAIFDRRTDIIRAASGSLNMAQYLCCFICGSHEIEQTQTERAIIPCDIPHAIDEVMDVLSPKVRKTVQHFCALGGRRNRIGIQLLEALAKDDEGFVSLTEFCSAEPERRLSATEIVDNKLIGLIYDRHPDCERTYTLIPRVITLLLMTPS